MKEKKNRDYGIYNVEELCTKDWTIGKDGKRTVILYSRARPFWFRDTLKDRCIEPVDVLLGLSAVH